MKIETTRIEFSKKLLILDYLLLIVLFVCSVKFPEIDFTTIIVAWIAEVGISSAAYYWKSKNENRKTSFEFHFCVIHKFTCVIL